MLLFIVAMILILLDKEFFFYGAIGNHIIVPPVLFAFIICASLLLLLIPNNKIKKVINILLSIFVSLIAAAISVIVFVTYNFWFHKPFEKTGIPTFILTIVIFVLTIVCLIFVCLKKKEENAPHHKKIMFIFSSIFSLASMISILLPTTLFLAQERQFKYFFYGEHILRVLERLLSNYTLEVRQK